MNPTSAVQTLAAFARLPLPYPTNELTRGRWMPTDCTEHGVIIEAHLNPPMVVWASVTDLEHGIFYRAWGTETTPVCATLDHSGLMGSCKHLKYVPDGAT